MLFLIFQIQNSYDQKPCIQDNHKFFICTHKPHSFLQDSETEWYHILPVAWVSILYCQGVAAVKKILLPFYYFSDRFGQLIPFRIVIHNIKIMLHTLRGLFYIYTGMSCQKLWIFLWVGEVLLILWYLT